MSSSTTKINVELNEPSTSANFSLTPQVNDVMEGKNTPLGSGDSEEVLNEEHDVYAEQRECIKEIMSSYDDTDSEDDQISSESEDEINVDMEQVAAEMKNNVELNKTVEDNKSNQWVCLYLHTYLFVTTIRSYDNHWKIKENKQMSNVFYILKSSYE